MATEENNEQQRLGQRESVFLKVHIKWKIYLKLYVKLLQCSSG